MANRQRGMLFVGLAALCAVTGIVAIWLVAFVAPIPDGMDLSQRIFYFHVPSAIAMYAAVAVCTVASVAHLLKGADGWDAAGKASAEVATAFCVIVLVTGPIWAWRAWGEPWVWDPRLTAVAALGLILGSYHLVRAVGEESPASRKLAAALGVLAAPNGALIHMAVRMWGGQHPTVIYERGSLDPTISALFRLCLASGLLFFLLLLWWRTELELLRRRMARLEIGAVLGGSRGRGETA